MSFAVEPSPEISTRHDFALLCNARGYKDAVEIGTDQGVFARQFLDRFNGHWLLCVDPYRPHHEFPYDRTIDAMVAVQALAPHLGRFRFVRMKSIEAVPVVRSFVSPEFVYIDGSHEEDDVTADLTAWWDVLPPHGMIAGHDYDPAHPGVVAAVDRFARERDCVVRLTQETDFPPSWYIYRTEPETLMIRLFRSTAEPNPRVEIQDRA